MVAALLDCQCMHVTADASVAPSLHSWCCTVVTVFVLIPDFDAEGGALCCSLGTDCAHSGCNCCCAVQCMCHFVRASERMAENKLLHRLMQMRLALTAGSAVRVAAVSAGGGGGGVAGTLDRWFGRITQICMPLRNGAQFSAIRL